MKKNLLGLVVVFFAVVALVSCKGSDGPEAVAEKYLQHIAKQEWADAKKLGTENTAQLVDMLASFGGAAEVKEVKIEEMKCEVTEETAVCNFKSNGEADKLDMVKKDGKWLVDQKKEMPMEDETLTEEEVVTDETVVDETATDETVVE
jgi:hypothetical protein